MGVIVREKVSGSGVWWLFINHKNQRKARKIGRDKRVAMEAAKKIEAKLTLGDMGLGQEKSPVKTFREYGEIWLNTTVPAMCKIKTNQTYATALKKHVLPVFGQKPVTEINRLMVKKLLMGKSNDGYAPTTVKTIKNVIAGVLNLAIDDEILLVNPAHKLGKVVRQVKCKFEGDALSREEMATLLAAFEKHYSPQNYAMAMTLARTGMRIGELCALQWSDIDFNSRFILVQRSITNNGIVSTPKNGRSRRVDMSLQLTDTLKELRQQRRMETLKNGWGQVPDWVFISKCGTPVIGGNWRETIFHKALEKAGLRRIRVHDVRHSYATQLIQNGEPLAYIRDQLGHHSISLTVDTYGHLAPQGNIGAVDRLDDDATIRNPAATEACN